jgi:hypothetical protein
VAYVVFPTGASSVIYVAPLDGTSAPKSLTSGLAQVPRFSRDGTKLYYSNRVSTGLEIRQIGVDGTNDHVVYGPCGLCYALGEDPSGRVFVLVNTAPTDFQGPLYTLSVGSDGGPALTPWPGDPGCVTDANLSAAGNLVAVTTGCQPPLVALGAPASTTPLVGRPPTAIEFRSDAHVQTAVGRIYLRAWPRGTDAGPLSPIPVYSVAPDGSDPRDLKVGEDAGDFVVADDASFVLVSHGPALSDGGALPLHSIAAHAGSSQRTVPGLGAIPSFTSLALAWTAH